MANVDWHGIFPALTTKFRQDQSLDLAAIERHICGQLEAGVDGIVVLGSLGESAMLSAEERQEVIRTAVRTVDGRVPVLTGVVETTTANARRFVAKAEEIGAIGFMLLPGMLYTADRRETITHLRQVAAATRLPIMLYNNPVAYRIDITPEMFADLADEPAFVAIKESSDDVRRISDIRNLVGDRYRIFTGVDDLALESLIIGAVGWVAGLVCAFPRETIALYRLVRAGRMAEALALYRWFTPLLHLDVSIKFVQNIKLAESMTGLGSETVRAPRLPLAGEERSRVVKIIEQAIATRPDLPKNL